MIGRQVLEQAMPEADITDQAAATAEKMIFDFAVKDIDDMQQRMEHLLGLRLLEALADPNASASHINSAMKWIENQKDKNKDQSEEHPLAAAMANARQAMREGGKLPDIDEYAEDQV